ncbi:MAG: RNA polymerase sigma factor [Deltaproteobacteria bacterium]|nr:MAG: RNA polymerase sigma factor [Deltaproteobacteria bacterium]
MSRPSTPSPAPPRSRPGCAARSICGSPRTRPGACSTGCPTCGAAGPPATTTPPRPPPTSSGWPARSGSPSADADPGKLGRAVTPGRLLQLPGKGRLGRREQGATDPEPRPGRLRVQAPVSMIHEHRRYVVGLARRFGRGCSDPEDLAQDVLERWVRSAPYRAPVDNPQAWMGVVLRHLIIDRLRHNRAARVVVNDEVDGVAAETAARPWWQDLDTSAIEREVSALPPALRETFRMFAFESRSYKDIARQLNIAKGTVGVRISRARALLKQRLTERGEVVCARRRPAA